MGRISELPSFSFFREKMRIRESRAMHQGRKNRSSKIERIIKSPVKNPRLTWERVWTRNAREKRETVGFLLDKRKNIKLTP